MAPAVVVALILVAASVSVIAAGGETGLEGRTLYRLQIDGMVCPFCAYSVEQRLQGASGVEYVNVDIESSRVIVGVQPGHRLEEERLRKLIEDAGFQFKGLERRPLTRAELRGR